MEGFKEFHGKNLDAAIKDACSYFDTSRERLEIEILQDARSGIFGIVGARKAIIRARRARLRDAVESVLGEHYGHRETPAEAVPAQSVKGEPPAPAAESAPEVHEPPAAPSPEPLEEPPVQTLPEPGQESVSAEDEGAGEEPADPEDSQHFTPFEDVDPAVAEKEALEVIRNLIRPIIGTEADLRASGWSLPHSGQREWRGRLRAAHRA